MRRILFLFVFFSCSGFSQDFYWYYNVYQGATPDVVARAYVTATWGASQAYYWQSQSAGDWVFGVTGKSYDNHVRRSGAGCTLPATLDPTGTFCVQPSPDAGKVCDSNPGADGFKKITNTAGSCVSILQADVSAQCKYLAGDGTKFTNFFVTFDQDGNPQSPPSPEYMGCKVKILSVANCKLPASRAAGGISIQHGGANCKLAVSFTGDVADSSKTIGAADPSTGKSGMCSDTQDCTPSDLPQQKDQQPCNYVLDGEGRKVCNSFQYKGDPGSMDCGMVNGKFGCYTKPSSSNGLSIASTVDSKSNADGSTTETKTDVATNTICSAGVASCVSNVTTTSTTTNINASGQQTGSSTQCTGKLCPSNTNPDGNGDGLGDCTGNDCESGSYSAGTLAKPSQGSFDGQGDEWDQKIDKAKQDFQKKLDDLKGVFSPIANVNLSSGGGLVCPEAVEVLGQHLDLCIDRYRDQLSWISLAIFLVFSLLALWIVFI